MQIKTNVWYSNSDSSIFPRLPIEKIYNIDIVENFTEVELFNSVSNAVSSDSEFLEKINVTWQVI